MLYPIIQQSANPVAAIGHVGILFKYQIIKRIISFVILIITIGFGIKAICVGILLNSVIEAILSVYVEKKELGIGFREHLRTQFDVILLTVGVCFTVLATILSIEIPSLKLIAGIFVGLSFFICATFLFDFQEKEYFLSFYGRKKK